ncbi:MAG: FAD:protein FMN transferase [Bacteroidota bacterium]|nr:FAD:protein FMN transferase [Bacteroidota bacterium]
MQRNIILLLIIAATFLSCKKQPVESIKLKGLAQGTYYSIIYYDSLQRDFSIAVDSLLDEFNLTASTYHKSSIVSKINRNEPTELNDIFIDIFVEAQNIAKETDGDFDITVKPLVNMWGFGGKKPQQVDQFKIDSILQFVGYEKVKLIDNRIEKDDDRLQLDYNSIAQGYSADWIARFFELKGIKNYLIDVGGEVLGKGTKPNNSQWMVGIELPAENKTASRQLISKVKLLNRALATSGSYRKYYEKDGKRYSHTLNPHTGYPAQHKLLSVSILADDCCSADAYATACMSMGFEKAKKFVEQSPQLEAYFIVADSSQERYMTYATKGLKLIMSE